MNAIIDPIKFCPQIVYKRFNKDPEYDMRQEFGKLIEIDIANFTELQMERYLILKLSLNI